MIKALLRNEKSVESWSQIFGVSRKTAYKWRARFLAEGARGLWPRSRRPQRMPRRLKSKWIGRIRRLRQEHPTWGPKKLWAWFERAGWHPPAVRTTGRWLSRLKLVNCRRRRPRKACVISHPRLTLARRPNHVWTADFKGWFRTGNGERCEPLTVRDAFSRYGLLAAVLPSQHVAPVKAAFARLFKQHGLPEVIRVDNGGPFASRGPAGLSQLSAWWTRLGIHVEFIRPAKPQDNGSHEQFHRVLKAETTQPTARTRRGQQHRCTGWLRQYNRQRPHEALGQKTPAQRYRRSPRKLPTRLPTLRYAAGNHVRQVRSNGEIRWAGRKRFIGEAFVGQAVGLRQLKPNSYAVSFANLLIGHLHEEDVGAMRPAVYEHIQPHKNK